MNKLTRLSLFILVLFLLACDAKLFETEEEPPAPEVSEIFTSLSNLRILVGDSAKFWINASNPGEGGLFMIGINLLEIFYQRLIKIRLSGGRHSRAVIKQ